MRALCRSRDLARDRTVPPREWTAIEARLIQLKAKSHGDYGSYAPMLNHQLGNLMVVIESADAAPTASMHEAFAYLAKRAESAIADARSIMETLARPRRAKRSA